MRPPDLDEQALIGIDVGGSKAAVGVIAYPGGEILVKESLPTPRIAESGSPFVATLAALTREMNERAVAAGWRCSGVGIGLCELIGPDRRPTSAQRVDWRDVDAIKVFGEIAPTVLESDIRTAALAEARLGRGQNSAQFVYVNLGTGISSCLMLDGVPFAGARGNALVAACGPVPNVTGMRGSEVTTSSYVPEDIAGGEALVARYRARKGLGADVAISVRDVLARAATGDETARDIVALGGKVAGSVIGLLVNILDPELVIIGGGVGLAGGLYWDETLSSARATIWSDASRSVPIVPSGLGTDAGLIGAALCAASTRSF